MARQRFARKITIKNWEGGTIALSSIGTTQSILSSLSNVGGTPITCLRTRGAVLCIAEPNAATDTEILALGLIVVKAQAAAIGGTSLPGPIANPDAEWAWHQFIAFDAVTATAGDPQAITLNMRVEIDTKAMRKLGTNEEFVLMAEVAGGAMASVNVLGGIRFLVGH